MEDISACTCVHGHLCLSETCAVLRAPSLCLRSAPNPQLLASVGDARLDAMHRSLIRHRRLFLWGAGGSAYNVTMHQLCSRAAALAVKLQPELRRRAEHEPAASRGREPRALQRWECGALLPPHARRLLATGVGRSPEITAARELRRKRGERARYGAGVELASVQMSSGGPGLSAFARANQRNRTPCRSGTKAPRPRIQLHTAGMRARGRRPRPVVVAPAPRTAAAAAAPAVAAAAVAAAR